MRLQPHYRCPGAEDLGESLQCQNCGFPVPKWAFGSDVVDGFGGGSVAPQKSNGKYHNQNQ